jgi:hypothetical protein
VLAALLVPTGLHTAAAYDRAHLARCVGRQDVPACDQAVNAFFDDFSSLGNLIDWASCCPA